MTTPQNRLNAALADRYRVERELGQGGMATVYLAEDLKHKRKVALKVLKPELAAVLGAERFVQEITTTAALQHPHILPLFDSGAADGFLFYVMPFTDGETLRAKLDRETQLGVDDAVRIAREVLDALDYAHTRGIVHRDVKPENIMLHGGHAMVVDFGIALAVSAAAGGRMTETGLSLGTPHYMSPEQATAEKEITPRSDVYSLGSVLYEMLTGNAPFTGANAQQIIMKIITEPAEVVTKYRKAVPTNVAAAVAKSLEKLPADRFETAKAFADALNDARFTVASMASTAHTTGAPGWCAWLREPRTIGALVVIAALAALAGLRGNGKAASASMGTVRLSVIGPKDTNIVAMQNSKGGFISLRDPVVSADGVHLLFSVATSKGASLTLRALNRPEFRTVVDIGANGGFFSPDGSRVGFFTGSELWTTPVADVKLSRVSRIPENDYDIASADWHPDGRILVAGARGLWEVPEPSPEAFEAYLRGRSILNHASTKAEWDRALDYFGRAMAADSAFAEPHAAAAFLYQVGAGIAYPYLEAYTKAESLSRRAIQLDDQNAEAHTTLGWATAVLRWDWAEAQRELERALALNPNSAQAHFTAGLFWAARGQLPRALDAARKAARLDPAWPLGSWWEVSVWVALGEPDSAIVAQRRADELHPGFILLESVVAGAYRQKGMLDTALALDRAASAHEQHPTAGLVLSLVALGRRAEAKAAYREMVEFEARRQNNINPETLAVAAFALGDRDGALTWFEKGVDMHSDAVWMVRGYPELRPLLADPRYQRLLDRMHLPH